MPAPIFFCTQADFRALLGKHPVTTTELFVDYHKVGSGKPNITYRESVDEALCFDWIDGVRNGIDGESYMMRFTPRKPKSIWSNFNTNRVGELTKLGRMHPAVQLRG